MREALEATPGTTTLQYMQHHCGLTDSSQVDRSRQDQIRRRKTMEISPILSALIPSAAAIPAVLSHTDFCAFSQGWGIYSQACQRGVSCGQGLRQTCE